MVKKIGQSFLAILMTLAMLAGLLPALTITATASEGDNHAPMAGFGKAMSFGDTFATVKPAADGSQDITGAFTVEMWIKRTRTDADAAYVFARNGGDSGQWAVLSYADRYAFYTSAKDLGVIDNSKISVSDTNWHHIAYTYVEGKLTSYLDGVESGSTEVAVTLLNANDFCIGNSSGGANPAYDALDELRLWNICRTGDEIRADMYRSISTAASGLVFYCKFEEGSGQSITESVKKVSGTVYSKSSPTVSSNGVWVDSVPNPVWATAEGTAVSGYLIGSDVDGDALTYSIVSPASHGVAAITPNTNQFTYRPDNGFNGSDSFTYKVTDPAGEESAVQTVNVTVTPTTPFYEGNAINFADGNDSLSSAYLTNKTSNITMEAWVKADTLPSDAKAVRVMYNGDSAETGYGIYLGSNKPCILMGGKAFIDPSPAVSLTTSQWYHLAAVLNGTTWTLYVNGVAYTNLIYSDTRFVGAAPNAPVEDNTFTVGNRIDLSENFTGCIDEVRFWTVARTEQQIKDNMYIKLKGTETGLLAYYNFEQGTAGGDNHTITTVTDVAGNDNYLTISGFALNGNTSNFVPSVNLGTFALGRSAYYAKEGVSSVTIPIVRTGGSEGSVTINYQTADGTALAGTDYTSTSGSVTFAAGETTKEVSVPILNSSIGTQKTFTFTIAGQSGVSIAAPSATVTITSKRSIVLGAAAIVGPSVGTTTAYNYIYFGNNTTPIKWRVLDTKTSTGEPGLFLLSDALLAAGQVYFDNTRSTTSNAWQGSDAQSWCNTFESRSLSKLELAAILKTNKNDTEYTSKSSASSAFGAAEGILNNDQVFFLSAEEAENSEYGFTDDTSRMPTLSATRWWLRSPCADWTFNAGAVSESGKVENTNVEYSWAARPALNLNLDSVLFTSFATGAGKVSSAVGADALTAVDAESPTTNWKLTLKDYDTDESTTLGHDGFSANLKPSSSATVEAGGSVEIAYSGAKVGTAEAPEYLSAMLVDSSDNVLYYGWLKSIAAAKDASGTQSVTIPAGLPTGAYTLKVFNEQYNGITNTDYSSAFANVALTVKTPAPTATTTTTYNVTNAGTTQVLTLDVTGIVAGHADVTWTMAETTDTNNILTLPNTTTGTLSNNTALSLGSITIAANEVGQPAKSGKVTISFSGGANYASLPAAITVTFNLAKGAAPAAPTLALDYGSETITGVASGMEYVVDTSATADNWTGATEISSSAALGISARIVANGETANYIHIRVKAADGGDPGTATSILIPARPAATAFAIDYDEEKTTAEVPATEEYKTTSTTYSGTWSRGTGEALALSPSVSVAKTYYFRTAATESSFAGAVQTLAVPIKPLMPTGANITAVSEAGTADLTTKLTFTIKSGSGYEYAIVADKASFTSDTVWTAITDSTSFDNISGRAATDDVYVRVKADDLSFKSDVYQILGALTISKLTYSGEQAAAPTVSSKTDVKVVLNAVTVTDETVEYVKNTTNSAPSTGWQDSPTFEGLAPGTPYFFFARVKETADHYAGAAAASESVTTKANTSVDPSRLPDDITVTATSITISTVKGIEYLFTSNGDSPRSWAGSYTETAEGGSKKTFSGLSAQTRYYIHIRVAETETTMPSINVNTVGLYTAYATPTAADFTVTQPTASSGEKSTGAIVPVDTTEGKYEYRIKTDGVWPDDWTTLDADGLPEIEAPATIELRVKSAGDIPASAAYTVTINKYVPPYSPSAPPKVPIVVDGQEYNIGTAKTESGVTTVTVDQTALQKQLDSASDNVVIPVNPGANADTVTAKLVVANVDEMAQKEMTLSVQVDDVSYVMPAVAIDTDALMKELGATDPAKVPVNVTIKELDEDDVTLETGELMLPPVEFTVTASYSGRNTEIDVFNKYVQRVIKIPSSVDAGKITTAVVVENGKQRHVPTEVFQKDGKWYARINSLTNSVYALISNEKSFSDAESKWFEAVVTEMASRGIINGRDEKSFDGDGNITRAEFAAILVRALGLPENGDASAFRDVASTAWYYGAVGKAYEYGLISGRGEGAFDPTACITRQEAMQMIFNASKVAEYTGKTGALTGFADADSVAGWAQNAAQFSVGSELILGSNGKLNPTTNITRAESATVILRLLRNAGLVDVRTNA